MNKLFNTLAPFLFLAACVLFTIFGIHSVKQQTTFIKTEATITNIYTEFAVDENSQDTTHVIVKYTVDGKEYENELGSYTSGMKEGSQITIKYNPESPDDITLSGGFSVIAYFGFAVVCLIAGVVTLLRRLKGIN